MKITILFFGQLAALTAHDRLHFDQVKNTDELMNLLKSSYPSLNNSAYTIAVDQKLISENTILNPGAVVALLPPFSGG